MTPAQQKEALKLLKGVMDETEDAVKEGRYPDDSLDDVLDIRVFLTKVGYIPDRRKKK